MKMMFLYGCFLYILSGCRGKEVHIAIPYSGDKLVLWGSLKANQSFRIRVTKTFNPVGALPADIAIDDAKVLVIKNGKHYTTLESSGENGIYISDSLVQPGAEYQIRVSHTGFTTAESEPVAVSKSLTKFSYKRDRGVTGSINVGIAQDLVAISFEKQEKESYYLLSIITHFGSNEYISYWPSTDNVVAKEKDCFTWMNDEKGRREAIFLFSDQCIPLSDGRLKFFTASEVTFVDSNGTYVTRPAQRMEARIGIVNKAFYEYAKAQYNQPEGIDLLVLPPQAVLTNIRNGYGLIFTSNEQTIELK